MSTPLPTCTDTRTRRLLDLPIQVEVRPPSRQGCSRRKPPPAETDPEPRTAPGTWTNQMGQSGQTAKQTHQSGSRINRQAGEMMQPALRKEKRDGRDARAANPGQAETLSLDTDMTSASRAKSLVPLAVSALRRLAYATGVSHPTDVKLDGYKRQRSAHALCCYRTDPQQSLLPAAAVSCCVRDFKRIDAAANFLLPL